MLVPIYRRPLGRYSPSAGPTCGATPGEISFPGGRQDQPDEDLRDTALREAHEEIGLDPAESS